MRTVALTLALTLSALTACGSLDNDPDTTNMLCRAAKSWVSADPSIKQDVSSQLSAAVEKAAGSVDATSPAGKVLDAARKLLSANAQEVTEGAEKIKEFC
jgi:hypothetical protein